MIQLNLESLMSPERRGDPLLTLAVAGGIGLLAYVKRTSVAYCIERGLWTLLGHVRRGKNNVYLQGNYAPVDESEAAHLEVEGSIPADLEGCFVRTGPNPFFEPVGDIHWFDGDGMTHAVRIKNGKASYGARYVDTYRLRREKAVGWPFFFKIGDLRGIAGIFFGPLMRLKKALIPVDESQGAGTANTALVYHANRLLSLAEGDLPYELKVLCDGVVETVGRLSHLRKDGWDAPFTAHPKRCPKTAELHFFGYRFDKRPYVQYGVLDAKGALIGKKGLDFEKPLMMHDFAITENFAVFLDVPLRLDGEKMVREGELIFSHATDEPLRFALTPRISGAEAEDASAETQWFDTFEDGSTMPSLIAMHVGNAWEEEGGSVVCLLACLYARFNLDITKYKSVSGGDPKGQGDYALIRLNRTTGRVASLSVLHPDHYITDFPRVHDEHVGLPSNRFSYVATISKGMDSVTFDGFIKVDHQTTREDRDKAIQFQSFGEQCFGGECVFFPRKGATVEDDGYLATYVYHAHEERSRLHLYDSKDLNLICQIKLPVRVPYGFHGAWLTEDQVQVQGQATRS